MINGECRSTCTPHTHLAKKKYGFQNQYFETDFKIVNKILDQTQI